MNTVKKSYSLLVAVLGVLSLSADFTDVSVWERTPGSGEKQLLVLCGDIHEPEIVGCDQAEDVVQLLSTYARGNDHILVEDLHDIKGLAKRIDAFFEHHPHEADRARAQRGTTQVYEAYEKDRQRCADERRQAALYLLPYFARKQNISVTDIDFREFLSCGAPRLNVEEYEQGGLIIPWLLKQLVGDIAAFDDGPVLNKIYADIIDRYTPFMNYICDVMREQKLIFQDLPAYFTEQCMTSPHNFDLVLIKSADTIDFNIMHQNLNLALNHIKSGKATEQTRKDLMWIFTDLLDLSSVELIDALILHQLYIKQVQSQAGNTVFICVGQAHAAVVAKALSNFGYALVDQARDDNGVDIVKLCAPVMVQAADNQIVTVWSYITDTAGKIVEYVTELFA